MRRRLDRQEPYSLAICLKEMARQVAGWRIDILATDLSNEVLEKAKAGIYSQFEVQRGLPIQMLVKYFTQVGETWQISPEIRAMVQFRPFNLLNDFASLGMFDIVFCRNVLIYFDQPTKVGVLDRMAREVERDGYLLLGAAETVVGLTDGFKPVADRRGLYSPNAGARAAAPASRRGRRRPLANSRSVLLVGDAAARLVSPLPSSYGDRPACASTRRYEDHPMKVAQAISRALVSEGVTLCAGIAGQSIWPVIDAIGDCEEVSLMYARQERVAFDICDGFARASGNPAVVFTDAGPAAANLMGGIVNSWGELGAGAVPRRAQRAHQGRQQVHQGAAVPRHLLRRSASGRR